MVKGRRFFFFKGDSALKGHTFSRVSALYKVGQT